MNLYTSVNNVLKRLDDYPIVGGQQIWTRAEIELYLHDGYNAFCRQTKCILDFFYPENVPKAGNYVARWELGYFQSGMVAIGLLGHSGGYWEQDYAEASSTGPVNHTQPWEAQDDTYSATRAITWEDPLASRGKSLETANGDCTLTGVADIAGISIGLTALDAPDGDFSYFSYRGVVVANSGPAVTVTPSFVVSNGVVSGYVNGVLVHAYSQAPDSSLWVYGSGTDWDTYPPTLTSTESFSSVVTVPFVTSLHSVPEDNVTVDRATHDFGTLDPEYTRWAEQNDRSFQTTAGTPSRFLMDRDGMSRIRIVPAGDGQATTATVSGTFGLLRSAGATDGFGTWAPIGSWGALKEIPEHFPMGGPYGVPRRLYSDENNTRVEYWRLGKDLDEYTFELPDRFVKYVEFYAQAKALERDGPGQDVALSQHFVGRFGDGVARMVTRLGENKRSRLSQIGSPGKASTRPALARLPYRYGRATRGGY
jgi:hypothetical protein